MTELAQGESKDTHQAAYDDPCITHEPPGSLGPDLQSVHDSMTERLNEKVAVATARERKLENIHRLVSTGKESAASIITARSAAELQAPWALDLPAEYARLGVPILDAALQQTGSNSVAQ